MVRFQLDDVIRLSGNNHRSTENKYRFTINDPSSFFEVQFEYKNMQMDQDMLLLIE